MTFLVCVSTLRYPQVRWIFAAARVSAVGVLLAVSACGLVEQDAERPGPKVENFPMIDGIAPEVSDADIAPATEDRPLPTECDASVPVYCNESGLKVACNAQGETQVTEDNCVRLLTADKEGGVVCAVLGADKMHCFNSYLTTEIQLAGNVTKISIPDDSSYWFGSNELDYCTIDSSNHLFCSASMGILLEKENCSEVAMSDGRLVCSHCAGVLACNKEGVIEPVTGTALDVSMSDMSLSYLDGSGKMQSLASGSPKLSGSYRRLEVDEERAPCGLNELGLECLLASGAAAYVAGDFVDLDIAASGKPCVLSEQGEIACYQEVDENLMPRWAPTGKFQDVVTTWFFSCGLTLEGRVLCWDEMGLLDFVPQVLQ